MADLNFTVTAAFEQAAAGLRTVASDLDTVSAKLRELGAITATPNVSLGNVAQLSGEVDALKAKFDALSADRINPTIGVNGLTETRARIDELKALLDELSAKKATPSVELQGEIVAKIAEINAELDVLGAKTVHPEVQVDTDSAVANIRKLGDEGDSLAKKFQGLDLGGTWISSISAAVIPAIQSIGQLSGALGLIPAVAATVGTAFGAVAIGVQGMDTALKAAAATEKANEAAAQADARAQQANATATQAATTAHITNTSALQAAIAQGAAHIAQLKAQQAAGQNVTTQLAAANAAQASLTAQLKTAQAANTGNTGAVSAYTSAQKNATSATSQAKSAHDAAAKAADAQAAAMKNLAPAAQGVVSAILQLQPAFTALRMDVQQHLFEGLKQAILETASSALPVLRTGLDQMASSINTAVKDVASFIQQQSSISAWKDIFSNISQAATNLAGAIKPILQIITDVTQVGAQLLPGLATGFAEAAQKAADFVTKAKDTGQLKEWIQTGIDAVKTLWGIFTDLVEIIAKVTAAPGPGLLDMIKAILDLVLQLITAFPPLIPIVEAFVAAWAFAKITQGLLGMVTTIKEAATAVGLLTAAEKANATAAAEAGVANEAAATKAGNAWKAAGLLIAGAFLAVGADSILPQAKAGDDSAFAHMREELHQLALAIQDPKKALDDLQGEFAHFGDNFPNFSNSPFIQGFKDAWSGIKAAATAGSGAVNDSAKQVQNAYRDAFTPIPAIATGAMGGLNVVVNEGAHKIAATVGTLPALTAASLVQLAPAMRGPTAAALAGLLPIITSGMQNITNQVQGLSPQVQAAMAPLTPAMQQSVQSAMGGLLPIVSSGISNIANAVGQLPPRAGNALASLPPAMQGPVNAAMGGLLPVVTSGIANITAAVGQLPPQAGAQLTPLAPALADPMNTAIGGLAPIVTTGVQNITTQIGQLPPQAGAQLTPLQQALQTPTDSAFQNMLTVVQQGATNITDQTAQLPGQVQGSVGDMSNTLQPAGQSAMSGFYQSMIDFYNNTIVPWLSSIAAQIANLKGPVEHDRMILMDNGRAIMEGLHTGMQDRWAGIATWLGGLGSEIGDLLDNAGSSGWGGHHGHHGHHGGGGGGTPPPTTPPPVPENWGGSGAWAVALRQSYATNTGSLGSGRIEGVTRPVTGYARTGAYLDATPSVTTGGSSGTPPPVICHIHFGNLSDSEVMGALVSQLRKGVRVDGGGNVQMYFGK